MTEEEKKQYTSYLAIFNRLVALREDGVRLVLEGKPSEPEQIARAFVLNGEDSYQQEFHAEVSGGRNELRFSRKKTN